MLGIHKLLSCSLLIALGLLTGCGTTPCKLIESAGWQRCQLKLTRAVEPGQVLLVQDGVVQPIGNWSLGPPRSEPVEIANYAHESGWAFELGAGLGAVPGLPVGAEATLKSKGAKKVRVSFEDSQEHYLDDFINRSSSVRDLQARVDELLDTLRRDEPSKVAGPARMALPGTEVWLVLGTLTSKVTYSFHKDGDTSLSAPIPLKGIVVTGSIVIKGETDLDVHYRDPRPIAYNAIRISFKSEDGLQGATPESIRARRSLGGPDPEAEWRLGSE